MLDSFKRDEDVNERKMLHCASCKRETIHNAEARCSGTWYDNDGTTIAGEKYTIYRCGGCDTVCYETASWDENDIDFNEDGVQCHPETIIQYPAPVSAHFNFNTESTPRRLNELLSEMLYALAGSKMTLATIGLRLVIEFIVKDKKCTGRNLKLRIDNLYEQGHVDEDQKLLLHRIREKGNAGAHEALSMTTEELLAGMSITEGLLEKLYNGPARHEKTIARAKRLLQDADKQVGTD